MHPVLAVTWKMALLGSDLACAKMIMMFQKNGEKMVQKQQMIRKNNYSNEVVKNGVRVCMH